MTSKSFWHYFSELGINKDTEIDLKVKIKITNKVSIVTAFIAAIYFLIIVIFFPESIKERPLFIAFHAIIAISALPVLWLNKTGKNSLASLIFIAIVYILVSYNSFLLAQPFRSEPYLLIIGAFSFIVFKDLRIIIPIFLVLTVTYTFLLYHIVDTTPSLEFIDNGLIIRVLIYFGLLFSIMYILRLEYLRKHKELNDQALALANTNDQLQKLNFTKDKIFSIISHDLKSPIGSLKGLLSLLKDEHISIEEFKKATSGLDRQVNQLYESMNEMLIWSRSQLHGLETKPVDIDLRGLVNNIVGVNKLAARSKRIILTSTIPNEIQVYCDHNMLKSVIHNLITNAIKFTKTNGAISVLAFEMNNKVHIVVEDTGVGMSAEDITKILDRTVHHTTYGTNNEKGTGLGVIMCKEFVEKNNGIFNVTSEKGKGSSFEIVLPSKS